MDETDLAEIRNLNIPFEVMRMHSTPKGKALRTRTKVDSIALVHVRHKALYGLRRSRERKSVCAQQDSHNLSDDMQARLCEWGGREDEAGRE